MVVNSNDIKPAANDGDAARLERLITVVEVQTNMLGRLIGLLEPKRRSDGTATRQRRTSADRPIKVTPLVQAAVKRALARVHR